MPTATHTFSGLDTDRDDTTRPASAFVAALNVALEPGYAQGVTGNVLVPGYVPPVGLAMRSTGVYPVLRRYTFASSGPLGSLSSSTDVTTRFVLAFGIGNAANSTYYRLVPDLYRPGVDGVPAGAVALPYAQVFGDPTFVPDAPGAPAGQDGYIEYGYTYTLTASYLFFGGTATQNIAVVVPTGPADSRQVSPGGFDDLATIVEMVWDNFNRHRLVRYDPAGNGGAGSRTTLLEWAGLALSETLVPQGGIVDNILYYLDANGEIRAANLTRAAAGEYTPALLAADAYALHAVKRPPLGRPRGTRLRNLDPTDAGSRTTVTHENAWQFAVRYRYQDGEVTPLGPYSEILPLVPEMFLGSVKVPQGAFGAIISIPALLPAPVLTNFIRVESLAPSASPLVAAVEVCVRRNNETSFAVAHTFYRDNATYPVAGFPNTFDFYGPTDGGALTAAELAKQAEAVAVRTGVLSIAHSRLFGADCTEGYPDPPMTLRGGGARVYAGSHRLLQYGHVWTVGTAPSQIQYALAAGTYPDPASTYFIVGDDEVDGGGRGLVVTGGIAGIYTDLFTGQTVTDQGILPVYGLGYNTGGVFDDLRSLKGRATYQVGLRGYDALGRQSAVVPAVTGPIAAPDFSPAFPGMLLDTINYYEPEYNSYREQNVAAAALAWALPTLAGLPAWMETFAICVRDNDLATAFVQTHAADALLYNGDKPGTTDPVLNGLPSNAATGGQVSGQLWVDIGHLAQGKANGFATHTSGSSFFGYALGATARTGMPPPIGYVWTPGSGDRLAFLDEGTNATIVKQVGDYLVVNYAGTLRSRHPRIEIYSPVEAGGGLTYREATGRFRVLRNAAGVATGFAPVDAYVSTALTNQYLVPGVTATRLQAFQLLPGDIFRVLRAYASAEAVTPDQSTSGTEVYTPPNHKIYVGYGRPTASTGAGGTFVAAQGAIRAAYYEAMSPSDGRYSQWMADRRGRVALVVPGGGKQVRRKGLLRFSGVKVSGTQLNGTGSWEALDQYDKLPQEQGTATRLMVADQNASDGSVLLALQEFGAVSLYLGQQPIQADANTQLIAITNQVIGGDNSLNGGFGCQDKGSAVSFAGKVFYWCRERQELIRYHNGQTPLGETYTARTRLQALARLYVGGRVTGCFDPRRQEYLLTFQPVGSLPGTTLVWSERHNAWADAVSCLPEAGLGGGNELVTWTGGQLWRHLPTAPVGSFYGQYVTPWLAFVACQPGGLLAKTWQALGLVTPGRWVPVALTTPEGAASRILPQWLAFVQGVWRAAIRRNENTAGAGTLAQKLNGGRILQSRSLRVTLAHPPGTTPVPLTAATADFLINAGQQPNQ